VRTIYCVVVVVVDWLWELSLLEATAAATATTATAAATIPAVMPPAAAPVALPAPELPEDCWPAGVCARALPTTNIDAIKAANAFFIFSPLLS
jgi:hypothetical protein